MSSRSPNASASQFGWDFQYNAGIVMMLKNIKDAKSVRIEGKTEDIELELNDGQKIFGQAKGFVDPADVHNAKAKLSKALETLAEDVKTGRAKSLVYVTNSPNPFNDDKTISRFSGEYSHVPYKDLPKSCQDTIAEMCAKSHITLPMESFSVLVFDFCGDGENRYRIVRQLANELLAELGLSDRGWGTRAVERWQIEFTHNASQKDLDRTVTKGDMIWPLVVWACEGKPRVEDIEGFDPGEIDEIEEKYRTLIADNVDRFEFVTKVNAAFDDFRVKSINQADGPAGMYRRFVSSEWSKFRSDFDLSDCDERVAQGVISIILEKIIRSNRIISRIRQGVRL